MTIIQIIKEAFSVLTKSKLIWLFILLTPLSTFLDKQVFWTSKFGQISLLCLFLPGFVIAFLSSNCFILTASNSISGVQQGFKRVLNQAFNQIWRVIGVSIIGFFVYLPFLCIFLFSYASNREAIYTQNTFSIIIFFVISIFFSPAFTFSTIEAVTSEIPIDQVIKNGFSLLFRNYWKIVSIGLICKAITWSLSIAVVIVLLYSTGQYQLDIISHINFLIPQASKMNLFPLKIAQYFIDLIETVIPMLIFIVFYHKYSPIKIAENNTTIETI